MKKNNQASFIQSSVETIIKRIYLKGSKEQNVHLTNSSYLTADLGFDSVEILELIVEIEKKVGIQFPDSYLRSELFETVGSVILAIQEIMHNHSERVIESPR